MPLDVIIEYRRFQFVLFVSVYFPSSFFAMTLVQFMTITKLELCLVAVLHNNQARTVQDNDAGLYT